MLSGDDGAFLPTESSAWSGPVDKSAAEVYADPEPVALAEAFAEEFTHDHPRWGRLRRFAAFSRKWWVRYTVASVIAVLAVAFLLVPQMRDALHDLSLLRQLPIRWILVGAILEAISFIAYGLFTRGILPVNGRPSFYSLLRIDVVGAGLTHVLPGGGAAASGLRFKMLRDRGVNGSDAALGAIVQGVGSAIVVCGLLVVGVFFVLPTSGSNPLYLVGAIVGISLVVVTVGGWVTMVKAEDFMVRVFRRAVARIGDRDAVERSVRRFSARLSELANNPRVLVHAVLWSVLNWLFDAASLYVFVYAFGYRVDIGSILVAFGLANALTIVPVTPGGVGVVEGVLVPALVGFGSPKSVALLGVLSWRVFNFWAPIPAGALAWVSLRVQSLKRSTASART